mmetsp:Transcript_39136/g.124247  ORF Transcript_39136/g.124247 Transcript_39136/m.124247 type:complete len:691 (+) Transcript_39136:141-2213(+)
MMMQAHPLRLLTGAPAAPPATCTASLLARAPSKPDRDAGRADSPRDTLMVIPHSGKHFSMSPRSCASWATASTMSARRSSSGSLASVGSAAEAEIESAEEVAQRLEDLSAISSRAPSVYSAGASVSSTASPSSCGRREPVGKVLVRCCAMLDAIAGSLQEQKLQMEEQQRRFVRTCSLSGEAPLAAFVPVPSRLGGPGTSAEALVAAEAKDAAAAMWTWAETRKKVIREDLSKAVAQASDLARSAAAAAAVAAAEAGGLGTATGGASASAAAAAISAGRQLRAVRDRLAAAIVEARELQLDEEEVRPAEWQRRRLHNLIQDMQGQVRVYCRLRPLNSREQRRGDIEVVSASQGTTVEVSGDKAVGIVAARHKFDAIFAPGSQEQIFEECQDLAQSAVDGHNVTVLCYGQTGAGKTHTMYGTPSEPGIAVRMTRQLFELIQGRGFSVTGSLVELHNNRLTDLLAPATAVATIAIESRTLVSLRQESEADISCEGLTELPMQSADELEELVRLGSTRRAVSAHALNGESSRSHVLLTVKLYRSAEHLAGSGAPDGLPPTSKLLFCDLGGCERLKRSEAVGEQIREAIEINRSLSALGDVIEAVVQRRRHVPYRNHKLTQLLQDSLGGSAKALMFVNCSPAASSAAETVAALSFASRAKRVTNSSAAASSRARTSVVAKARVGSSCGSSLEEL